MAEDFRAGLEFAVDAAIALFQPGRVPRHIEMKQIPAMGLQVQTPAGGIGGDQDAQRMFGGRLVEGALI